MEAPLVAPKSLSMDRLGETKQLVIAQSTSQCCRTGCCQPSINWLIREADNFHGGNPHKDYPNVAWIHEESSYLMRCLSGFAPGCRKVKYVQHSSNIPPSVEEAEDWRWCTFQCDELPKGLTEEDRSKDVIATHEKPQTCTACCCLEPFLETKDSEGNVIGKTLYVCDACIFVPKFDIYNGDGEKRFRLRPDTCVGGCCVLCRCCDAGKGGKCCRVPFIVRNPETFEPVKGNSGVENAQVTQLWAGWNNECCTQRNAYHLVFPDEATTEDKLTLIGSSILIDIIYYEQEKDDGNNGGGGE